MLEESAFLLEVQVNKVQDIVIIAHVNNYFEQPAKKEKTAMSRRQKSELVVTKLILKNRDGSEVHEHTFKSKPDRGDAQAAFLLEAPKAIEKLFKKAKIWDTFTKSYCENDKLFIHDLLHDDCLYLYGYDSSLDVFEGEDDGAWTLEAVGFKR